MPCSADLALKVDSVILAKEHPTDHSLNKHIQYIFNIAPRRALNAPNLHDLSLQV